MDKKQPTATIAGKASGPTDTKRFYLPGVTIESLCPTCNEMQGVDFGSDYLSYPYIGKPFDLDFYCYECDNAGLGGEWSVRCILDVTLRLEEGEKTE